MAQPLNTLNHLIYEKSPYLLQHAHNPVDWYPWGKEAFEKAKSENKPIFLSIGYSTCHWCHVMAHESFEDDEVAKRLNQDFVCIKVDREERPDIDAVYMSVCQAMTGSGGWPLTVFLTPDQKPFFAGTYFPKHNRYGSVGLIELLTEIARQWRADRKKLKGIGEEVTRVIQEHAQESKGKTEPAKEILYQGIEQFRQNYDAKWGGFGVAPKFPAPHNLLFLFAFYSAEKQDDILHMAEHTLVQMYRGGMFDHVGGGFSRYSTDDKWLVPHFEKMLYDNALLALAYLSAYELTGTELYQTIARRIFDYTLKELHDPLGGFWCGQDADSDGVEGKYYVFSPSEIKQVLGSEDGEKFCRWFDITDQGNFEGKNIPNLISNQKFITEDPEIKSLRQKIYEYRRNRTKLHTDDKVLLSWNGLMIAALAKAGSLQDGETYLNAARRTKDFIDRYMKKKDGRLFLRWRDGEAAIDGQLDDYAFYAYGLISLYQATWDVQYFIESIAVAEKMVELFFDAEAGGFYLYASESEQLISRPKESYDGAIPSGNSVAAWVLDKLAKLTGEAKWRSLADQQFAFLAGIVSHYPAGHAFALTAMTEVLYPSWELICTSNQSGTEKNLMLLAQKYGRSRGSILLKTLQNADQLAMAAPFSEAYPIPDSGEKYYLCRGENCSAPVDLEGVLSMLKQN